MTWFILQVFASPQHMLIFMFAKDCEISKYVFQLCYIIDIYIYMCFSYPSDIPKFVSLQSYSSLHDRAVFDIWASLPSVQHEDRLSQSTIIGLKLTSLNDDWILKPHFNMISLKPWGPDSEVFEPLGRLVGELSEAWKFHHPAAPGKLKMILFEKGNSKPCKIPSIFSFQPLYICFFGGGECFCFSTWNRVFLLVFFRGDPHDTSSFSLSMGRKWLQGEGSWIDSSRC